MYIEVKKGPSRKQGSDKVSDRSEIVVLSGSSGGNM